MDLAASTVRYKGKLTSVAVHPLGVNADGLRQRAAAPDVQGQVAALTSITAGQRLIVRVNRTELSKNIVRGLAAYRELLVTHPEWRGQVTHLAFAYRPGMISPSTASTRRGCSGWPGKSRTSSARTPGTR